MTTLREAWNRIQSFFHKPQRDADLDAELQSHLELAIEENLQQGMPPDEARRKALIRFGGIPQAKEQQREARGLPWLDILLQDLRFTFRTLRRDPTFTIIAVIILGLGIGANVVVFSVVNTVLLRPLPFRNPEQLVRLAGSGAPGGESSATYSADAMQEFQQRNRSFQEVTGYFAFSSSDNYKLIGNGQPLPVTGLMVADNFFKTLAIQPTLGRLFTPEECLKNSRPVTLLSHAFWKRQFHADPNIVGQTVNLDNKPVTVVGVLPDTFDFGAVFSPGARIDIYTPVIMNDIRHWGNTMALVGRLNPGVTVAQAQAEANLLFPKLDHDVTHPEWKDGYTTRFFALKDYVSGKLRRSLIVLWAAVGMILLIVCVNLSNLLLARAAAREKEFALRSALGAPASSASFSPKVSFSPAQALSSVSSSHPPSSHGSPIKAPSRFHSSPVSASTAPPSPGPYSSQSSLRSSSAWYQASRCPAIKFKSLSKTAATEPARVVNTSVCVPSLSSPKSHSPAFF